MWGDCLNCETCKERYKQVDPVPFYVHESAMARQERTIKRLWILAILLIVLLFGSNAAWVWYENQFVDESVWQEVDTGEGDAYIAGIGDVTIGESPAKNDKANP